MSNKYYNLLSPMKVGNTVLKNRMIAAPGFPYLLQGPEHFPAEGVIASYANKAKSGAALIVCKGAGLPAKTKEEQKETENAENKNS